MNNFQKIIVAVSLASTFTACKKDKDPIIVINNQASSGVEKIKFNGIAGAEPGSAAGNSVYVDFSTEKLTTTLRSSWDLGFYAGTDFRVTLNNTASAGVKVLSKFNLNTVGAADTVGLSLATSQTAPEVFQFAFFDNVTGDIMQTAIPTISAIDIENPVIILNRGTGGGIAPRAWIKMRILRNVDGYTIQYAGINETTFRIASIVKNNAFHFQNFSFDNGIVNAQPEKMKWDLVWTYAQFQANFGAGFVPYNFSDLIAVNSLSGVEVKQKVYADATTATNAFAAYNRDSVTANPTSPGRWTIGSNWRSTQPATGARQDRFYIIKDPIGNYYKVKCLTMGVNDGGERGRPEFKYALIQ
jgi:HmuY protein